MFGDARSCAYFVGYAEMSKGYRFYCPHHSLRFVELRNAKFLENDIAGGSDFFSERKQPSTLSERLIVIQNIPHVQMGVAQPINEDPQTAAGNAVDQVVHQVPYMVEQPATQHDSHGNVELTLRRSTRVRILAIQDDYYETPRKFEFSEKGQNRNFDKNQKFF